MADRVESLNGWIWADGAGDPPAVPVTGVTYATSALLQATVEGGWPYNTIVNGADFNEFLRKMTTLVSIMEQYGLLTWCATVTYQIGAVVVASNNIIYKAVVVTVGDDPTTDDGTNWEHLNKLVTGETQTIRTTNISTTSKTYVTCGLETSSGFLPVKSTNKRKVRVSLGIALEEPSNWGIIANYALQYNDPSLGWVTIRDRTVGFSATSVLVFSLNHSIHFEYIDETDDATPQYRVVHRLNTTTAGEISTILAGSYISVEELPN